MASTDDRRLLIKTTYRVHPDDAPTFKDITSRMAADARQRKGCVFLAAGQDIDDPAVFHLTEGWDSQEAIDEHLASSGFQAVLAEAMKLRIQERTAIVYEVSASHELGQPG